VQSLPPGVLVTEAPKEAMSALLKDNDRRSRDAAWLIRRQAVTVRRMSAYCFDQGVSGQGRLRCARRAGACFCRDAVHARAGGRRADRLFGSGAGLGRFARKQYYSRDQGSRLIPLDWARALKQENGKPFLDDSLSRYGYLANPDSSPPGLPVGFAVANYNGERTLGLTCAACHTRQIEAGGTSYRIDGGPAIADLWSLWGDLDEAVGKVLASDANFAEFGKAALGPGAPAAKLAALRTQVSDWYARSHAITERGLPTKPWGWGPIDAVGMILNRVTGLDIGKPPSYINKNILAPADAPVRPPFVWNAWRQDHTQWPGFAENGDDLLALARNAGEVFGVFGVAHPMKDPAHILGVEYLTTGCGFLVSAA
jgi:hypothetical protein